MRRVNEAVREVLSRHISERLRDPRIGFVTLTAVDTSPDLSHARVFVTVLGEDERRAETMAGLRSARGVLQAQIGRELRLKRTPTLDFFYDESTDRGMRVQELLGRVLGEREAPETASGAPRPQGSEDEA